jgi:dTDP-4-dehydrorhamnose reductase
MDLPRILLIGKRGQVAWELQRTLAPMAQMTCWGSTELDLSAADTIRQRVRETRPQVVVNAGGYTAVDKAESEPDLALKINGVAPGVLAEECKRLDALLVHYSTDYIFDGAKREPYLESDLPNPLGVYGRSKLAGEQAIQAVGGAHLIFRLCWVYGARGQNFMLRMFRLAREREKLHVVNDQVGCPTWSRMIAEATTLALKQAIATRDFAAHTGTYHLAASGQTSWHGFARAIVGLMGGAERKVKIIEEITTAEYPTPACRPAYSVLNCEKLRRTFGLQLPHWEESLRQVCI